MIQAKIKLLTPLSRLAKTHYTFCVRAALLHILHQRVNSILGGHVMDLEVSPEMPVKLLKQAKPLYNIHIQQKTNFLQVLFLSLHIYKICLLICINV